MPRRIVNLREHVPLLDIVSYGRRGPGESISISRAQMAQIERTVRRVPEVMVKVSGGGKSAGAVAAHFKYIDRHGRLPIETDDGEQLKGRGIEKALMRDWDLTLETSQARNAYSGTPGRRPLKVVHNIVLSMPSGTPSDKLLKAAKLFARETFALKNRYAMVLHTDQGHPHVHLVVKAVGEDGKRLNIRKATLRDWRRDFAQALREYGVEANATERAVRGRPNLRKHDGIYRAMRRGASTHMLGRAKSVAQELSSGRLKAEAARENILTSRRDVERGWRTIWSVLRREGRHDLAARLDQFLNSMPPPQTERDWMAAQIRAHQRASEIQRSPTR
jgi:hypothetical protein